MRHEWITVQADSFCASVRDGTHDSPKPVDVEGRRLITSKHITGNRLDIDNAYQISEEDFAAIEKRSKVDRWDVLITMIGTVGEPCLVSESPDFAIKNIGLFKSRGEIQGKYLYYYLKSPLVQHHIKTRLRGTTQQYIPLGELRKLPVKQPASQSVMRSIVEILSSLDDKIELNRQINATLESMAQALFKSWFVDFDPVIDNALAAGNPIPEPLQARAEKRAALPAAASAADTRSASVTDNAHPTQTAPHAQPGTAAPALPLQPLPADLRALFPDSFVFNEEIGWVPEGWKPSNLIDLFGKGVVKTGPFGSNLHASDYADEGVPLILVKHVSNGWVSLSGLPLVGYEKASELKDYRLEENDIVVTRVGRVGSSALIPKHQAGWMFSGQMLRIRLPAELLIPVWFAEWLKTDQFAHTIDAHAVGSTRASLNTKILGSIGFVLPPEACQALFSNFVSPLLDDMHLKSQQSETLGAIRDSVLPRLLSGQMQLADAEMLAAEAL